MLKIDDKCPLLIFSSHFCRFGQPGECLRANPCKSVRSVTEIGKKLGIRYVLYRFTDYIIAEKQ